jgi:hypothetical protein
MSAGTARYTFRLPDDLMNAATQALHRRNHNTDQEQYDMSEFVRLAIEEKIAHMDRGRGAEPFRKSIKKRGVSDTPLLEAEQIE